MNDPYQSQCNLSYYLNMLGWLRMTTNWVPVAKGGSTVGYWAALHPFITPDGPDEVCADHSSHKNKILLKPGIVSENIHR